MKVVFYNFLAIFEEKELFVVDKLSISDEKKRRAIVLMWRRLIFRAFQKLPHPRHTVGVQSR